MHVYLFSLKFFVLDCLLLNNVLTESFETNVISSKGNIIYSTTSANQEQRIWKFSLHHERSGRPFVIRLLDFRPLDNKLSSHNQILILPDGKELSDLPRRDYWTEKIENATCWVYSTAATLNSTNCSQKYNEMGDCCEKRFLHSTKWPPKVSTRFEHYAMIMKYEFVDCQGPQAMPSSATQNTSYELGGQLTTHAPMAETSSRERSNTSVPERIATSSTITTTLARGNEVQTHLASREDLLYVVAALAIVLAVATVLLCVALCTLRKLNRTKTEDTALALGNVETDVNATSRSSFFPECAKVDSHYTMAEDVNKCPSLNKQTVENVLYEETK